MHALVKQLNTLYREHPALWALDAQPAGFRWLDADDNTGNLLSYLRSTGVVVIAPSNAASE